MIAHGATMSTDFAVYLCVISWNYVNSVVKVRRGPTFSPSRKVMTDLPYRPEARV